MLSAKSGNLKSIQLVVISYSKIGYINVISDNWDESRRNAGYR